VSVFLLGIVGTASGQITYVDADANGANDGSTWADAYNYLQDALADAASDGDVNKIWVAQGIYKPDTNSADPNGSGNREATFQLISGVALYGGFPSGGGVWNDRDSDACETILSGNINMLDVSADNSYHVVTGSGTNDTAVLDGFILTAGNARGVSPHYDGGGMYNSSGSPTLTKCAFSNNRANTRGGGLYNCDSSGPTLTNCTFSGNTADQGGAMYNDNSSGPTLINCCFCLNSAYVGGGVCNHDNSSLTLTNCTFAGNRADRYAGGMYAGGGPAVTNCIFWGNSDAGGEDESAQIFGGTPRVAFSCIQDDDPNDANIPFGGADSNNIDDNPMFVRGPSPGPDGDWDGVNSDYGDLHLQAGSPCVDAGDNNSIAPDTGDLDGDGNTTEPTPCDLDGHPRFVDDPGTLDTGNGAKPIVDMGADEFPYLGDLNFSGVVNFVDFAVFASAWQTEQGQAQYNPACDISIPPDGYINWHDLDVFADNWLLVTNVWDWWKQ
jgi:parallel beta-helix repeat protein